MALLMARIDDRLIHGQVIVGCCGPLRARRLILCNDEVAGDSMQRRIYAAGVPLEIETEFVSIEEGARRLRALATAGELESTLLIVGSCAEMAQLVARGAPISTVTVGGLHHRPGASERWPGFFLARTDLEHLRDLRRRGVTVELQTVPGASRRDLDSELDSSSWERP
jgi:mannose/fructose/N-acetylgalactosamine-specific phosphotransferase system component IIB